MIRWFRRRRPEPVVVRYTEADILISHMWGLTLTQWDALTDHERAECRRTITAAPKFRMPS